MEPREPRKPRLKRELVVVDLVDDLVDDLFALATRERKGETMLAALERATAALDRVRMRLEYEGLHVVSAPREPDDG